jgi:hypothetical protein
MKKTILTALVAAGVAGVSYGQGVLSADGSTGTKTEINGTVNTTTDINWEVLYNNGSSFVPLVTFLLSTAVGTGTPGVPAGTTQGASGSITFNGDGSLYDQSGNTYQVPGTSAAGGSIATLEVEGWTGNGVNSYASAVTKGITASFTESVNSAANPTLTTLNNMPLLNLTSGVPEPATFAMMGLGGLSLLLFRRRS